MKDVTMSENEEAVIVLIATIGSGITGFLAACPIPADWKAPAVALSGTISTAILVFWKTKINKQSKECKETTKKEGE